MTYTNPVWSFLCGGRIACCIAKFKLTAKASPNTEARVLAVNLVAKGLWEQVDFRRVSGGIGGSFLDGLIQVSPQFGYDYSSKKSFVEVFVGTDLTLLFP
jgi:hypothetical protein